MLCKIVWSEEDLKDVFKNYSIEYTEENIKIFKDRYARSLHERSIEAGWEILDTLVSIMKDQGSEGFV
jgi:effector-binding domain-containing protein